MQCVHPETTSTMVPFCLSQKIGDGSGTCLTLVLFCPHCPCWLWPHAIKLLFVPCNATMWCCPQEAFTISGSPTTQEDKHVNEVSITHYYILSIIYTCNLLHILLSSPNIKMAWVCYSCSMSHPSWDFNKFWFVNVLNYHISSYNLYEDTIFVKENLFVVIKLSTFSYFTWIP